MSKKILKYLHSQMALTKGDLEEFIDFQRVPL